MGQPHGYPPSVFSFWRIERSPRVFPFARPSDEFGEFMAFSLGAFASPNFFVLFTDGVSYVLVSWRSTAYQVIFCLMPQRLEGDTHSLEQNKTIRGEARRVPRL